MNENYYHQHENVRMENGINMATCLNLWILNMRKITGINLAFGLIGPAPSEPQSVGIDVRRLSNTSTLRWEAPAIGKAKGYYVLKRKRILRCGKRNSIQETTLTIPIQRTIIFWCAGCRRKGHESMAVFPSRSQGDKGGLEISWVFSYQ